MKLALEVLSETFAAAAAILWFLSARVRLRKRSLANRGLGTGLDERRLLLRLVYEQSQWSARAAIAAGLTAIFAIADGVARWLLSCRSRIHWLVCARPVNAIRFISGHAMDARNAI
jgi:hypothetical protein